LVLRARVQFTEGISASHYIIIADGKSVRVPIDEVLDSYIVQMPEAARRGGRSSGVTEKTERRN
jgi:hypothetical protein